MQTVSKDIRSRPVLDEWVNLGMVSIADKLVTLEKDAFLPSQDYEQKLYFFGKNVSDHLAAARINTTSEQPPFLERSVYYDKLSRASLTQLEQMAREEGMKMLLKLNAEADRLQKQDADKSDDHQQSRMTLGVYYFHDSTDDAS